MLQNRCLSCPVCDVAVLRPNGWMNQDRSGPSPFPNFRPVCCGQTAGWIKMSLGAEVGLGPGDILLDGDPAIPPQKRGTAPPPHISTHVYRDQTAGYGLRCYTQHEGMPHPRPHCVRWGPSFPFFVSIFGPCLLWKNGGMD